MKIDVCEVLKKLSNTFYAVCIVEISSLGCRSIVEAFFTDHAHIFAMPSNHTLKPLHMEGGLDAMIRKVLARQELAGDNARGLVAAFSS